MGKTKKISIIAALFIMLFMGVTPAHAHVVVKPAEVPVASYQTFSVGVPSEKALPTVSLRLVIPEGVTSVRPNVKPGWTISLKKDDKGNVTEIEWAKGFIPADQRDDFVFSAKVPGGEASLTWKAYQTYSDGSLVSWDQESETKVDDGSNAKGPSSKTTVVNDLEEKTVTNSEPALSIKKNEIIAFSALALASLSIILQVKKNR